MINPWLQQYSPNVGYPNGQQGPAGALMMGGAGYTPSFGASKSHAAHGAPQVSPGQLFQGYWNQGIQSIGNMAQKGWNQFSNFTQEHPYMAAGMGAAAGMTIGAGVCPYMGASVAAPFFQGVGQKALNMVQGRPV